MQRIKGGYGPQLDAPEAAIVERMNELRAEIAVLDAAISPLARAAGEIENQRWGLLMRAGNDKSHLARQVERSADIYTSRVSNFLLHTPFAYLRPPRGQDLSFRDFPGKHHRTIYRHGHYFPAPNHRAKTRA